MIRMIATDLDGTLLRSDKTISAYTQDVLSRARETGVKLVFATARPLRTALRFVGDIPVDAMVLHNGASTLIDGRPFAHLGIPAETTSSVLLRLNRAFPSAQLSAEIDDALYANENLVDAWNEPALVRTDFTDLPQKPAEKLVFCLTTTEELRAFEAYLPDDLYIQMCENRLGLVMHKNASKQNALCALAAHYGIDQKDVVAFGDDHNDIGMIQAFGTGVAMQNAIDAVLAVADCICENNDADGVAKWIDQHIL